MASAIPTPIAVKVLMRSMIYSFIYDREPQEGFHLYDPLCIFSTRQTQEVTQQLHLPSNELHQDHCIIKHLMVDQTIRCFSLNL